MNSSAGIAVLADGMAVVAEASVRRQEQCRARGDRQPPPPGRAKRHWTASTSYRDRFDAKTTACGWSS